MNLQKNETEDISDMVRQALMKETGNDQNFIYQRLLNNQNKGTSSKFIDLDDNASPLLDKNHDTKFDPSKKRFIPTMHLQKHDSMEEYNAM